MLGPTCQWLKQPYDICRNSCRSTVFNCQNRPYATRNVRVLKSPSTQVAAFLADFLAQSPRPLTLSKLLSYGRPLSPDTILASASYVLSEIPRRLARRIRALESLPFIVGTNPYVARILENHRKSLEWLATCPRAKTLEENAQFSSQLEHLVHRHANDIPTIARGFQECSRYMSQEAISEFLDHAIRNRIAVRLIAEQHIALSWALEDNPKLTYHDGVVNMNCSPLEMIKACSLVVSDMCEATFGISTDVVVDGHVDATFAYVPVHLQYVLTELLKNAFRATVEKHSTTHAVSVTRRMPPITVTISPFPRSPKDDQPSYMSLRIRDEGGGIIPSNMRCVFSYAFSTAGGDVRHGDKTDGGPYAAQHVGGSAAIGEVGIGEAEDTNLFGEITGKGLQTGVGTIAGLGYGLPMSRLYARYLGGSLDLFSLDGWGTDAILKLRCLSRASEEIEL